MNRRSCRSTKRSTGSDSRRRLSPRQSWKPPEAAIESDPYEAVYPLFVVAQKIKDNAGSGRLKHDGAAAALSARGLRAGLRRRLDPATLSARLISYTFAPLRRPISPCLHAFEFRHMERISLLRVESINHEGADDDRPE